MATSIGVGDILSCRAWTALGEQAAVNTYNYECISKTGSGCTDDQLATDRDTTLTGFYQALMPSSAEYRGVQIYFEFRFTGGALPTAAVSTASAAFGTTGTDPVPRNTCPILKYSTLARGPNGRGRVFLPFCSADYMDTDGRPNSTFQTLAGSTATAFLSPFTVGGGGNTSQFVWVLLTKHKGGPPTIRGQILQASSPRKFGQLHKRGDYGRPNTSPI